MFHIHRKSSVPLTEQICREFADRIKSGMLEAGSRLPSVRELSETLGVSLVTVVQAYGMLEQQGLVHRIHGKGTFVRGQIRAQGVVPARGPAFDWQLAISDYLPRAAVLGQHGRTAGSADIPFKMSMAALHPALAATTLPTNLHHVLSDAHVVAEYGPVEGLESLRTEVQSYLHEHGVHAQVEDILITNGVQQAIDMIARTFIGPGDVVVVEAPTYSGAIDVFRSRGAVIVSIPMDNEGIRLDLLTKQCDHTPPKLIYTMPTFQNPTGLVMSPKRRAALLDIAESYHCLVVEDDSFSDCSFAGNPPAPIKSLDKSGHVIYLKGFSKVFCAGCRIGAMVSSGSVRNRLLAAKSVSDLGSPTLTQVLIQACMALPNRRRRLGDIAKAVQRKRDIALEILSHQAPTGVGWSVPDGGFSLWITLPPYVNTDALLIDALQRGVSFLPSSACYANETVQHQLRISYAGLDDDALAEGVSRLCRLMVDTLTSRVEGSLPLV